MAKKFSLVEKYVRSRGMGIDDEKSRSLYSKNRL